MDITDLGIKPVYVYN